MKNNISEREKINTLEWFQKIFATIFEKKELFMKGFSKAREEYPELCFLLQIYSGYFQYLVRWQKSHSRRKRYSAGSKESELPFPPTIPFLPFPPFPPKVPIEKFLEELNKIAVAELKEISERMKECREQVRTCREIMRDFKAAAACVQSYTENLPQSDEEWEEYNGCLENLQIYTSEMEANGCLLS